MKKTKISNLAFALILVTSLAFAVDAGLSIDSDGKVNVKSILNLQPQNSPPPNPSEGDMFYNDTKDLLLFSDGKWESVITYSIDWFSGNWGTCSKTCGGGTQTRSSTCQRSDGQVMPDSYCGEEPAMTQACNTQACSYSWIIGSYSSCSNTCGSGTQTRSVVCKRTDGLQVADSYCGTKPAVSRACTSVSSCTYAWSYTSWGACDADCNRYGTQTRSIVCKRSDGSTVSDSYCGSKPDTSKECYRQCGS